MKRFYPMAITLGLVIIFLTALMPYAVLAAAPSEVWVDDDWVGSSCGAVVRGHTFCIDAFAKIQDAINAVAPSGTVYVAQGMYRENIVIGQISQAKTIKLLGGYSSSTWVRNSSIYISTITAAQSGPTVHALWAPGSIIDGFQITGSKSFGIHATESDVLISNNNIFNNFVGIFAELTYCTIENNQIHNNNETGVDLHIDYSTLNNNLIWQNGWNGVYVRIGANPIIQGNTIRNNGDGIYCDEATATITGNNIINNTRNGVHVGDDAYSWLTGNVITDNGGWGILAEKAEIQNNIVAKNASGGINVYMVATKIVNNTIVDNKTGGGIHALSASTIVNNIIWGNALQDVPAGMLAVTYSDIGTAYPGIGNISLTPKFVDAGSSNYHVRIDSPCIDAGTNTGAPADDIEHHSRPVNGNGDAIAVTDMGAYEYIPAPGLAKLEPSQYRWSTLQSPPFKWDPYPIFKSWTQLYLVNKGPGDAFNVTVTICNKPVNVTIIKGKVTLGKIASGSGAWSVDDFALVTNMTNPQDPQIGLIWKVEYDDASGAHHIIENVPQLPPK